jgi:hypothetical protein
MFKTILTLAFLGTASVYAAGVTGYLPNITYSTGQRTGQVVKLSSKGYLCKTWEGEMNMGAFGTSQTGALGTTMFEFSVIDPAIVDQVNQKSISGSRATIYYEQKVFPAPCQRETAYIITKVE